jgi:hypothetical protein
MTDIIPPAFTPGVMSDDPGDLSALAMAGERGLEK